MLKVALTGNYGSGKSRVLQAFSDMGALCMDADRIVAGLLEDPGVLEMIRKAAGDGVFVGGRLSKRKLADLIFADAAVRGAVEGIIHPLAIRKIDETLEKTKNSRTAVAFIEIPLLYEKGYERLFDKVIAVYVDESTALARLMAQGISPDSARQRLSVQMPLLEKVARADYVINNQGGMEETVWQARRIFDELVQMAALTETKSKAGA